MPVFEISDPQTGETVEVEGDSPPTEQELSQIFASVSQPQEAQGDFVGAGIIEPARAVASGLARTVVGGVAGTAQALNPFADEGSGAQTVKDIQAGAFQPETEAGKEGLKTLGDLVQKGVDIANFPISGLAGLVELVSGQGLEQAAETVKATQNQGISKTAGERVFEETGSPLAATIAETTPTAIGELAGLKGAAAAVKGAAKAGGRIAEGVKETVQSLGPTAEKTAKSFKGGKDKVFNFQTPYRKRIAEKLAAGSDDIDVAKYKLTDTGDAVKDSAAVNAVKQGFDEGVIAPVKASSNLDKTKFLEMVDIMEKGKKNKKFAIRNRPSDVAGDTLLDTVKQVRTANRTAGKELEAASQALKGVDVDSLPAINSFVDDLDAMGVTLDSGASGKITPNFKGSDIEGLAAPEAAIKRLVGRMSKDKAPNAHELHRLKKFIDENVTYGKSGEGLAGKTEVVMKNLRRNLDDILDKNFPEYDRVNTTYSETITALDALQDVAGKKMDLSGGNADKALGTLLRRTMSNAQSRVRLIDSIDEIKLAADKFGGGNLPKIAGEVPKGLRGASNLEDLVLFVDELDRVFGPVARTSFQGQIDQALKQGVNAATTKAGALDVALEVAGKVAEKAKGINEENAFKAIKELLKQGIK